MSVALALAALAVFDAMLAGFRAVAGRDGRIDKRGYFRRAIGRGAIAGVAAVVLNAAIVAVFVASGASWDAFVAAGASCMWVFGAFATATIAAMAFWLSPMPELRLLATVLVLGPLTLLRPLVIVGGLVLAATRAGDPRIWIAAALAAVTMLGLERVLAPRVPRASVSGR